MINLTIWKSIQEKTPSVGFDYGSADEHKVNWHCKPWLDLWIDLLVLKLDVRIESLKNKVEAMRKAATSDLIES